MKLSYMNEIFFPDFIKATLTMQILLSSQFLLSISIVAKDLLIFISATHTCGI